MMFFEAAIFPSSKAKNAAIAALRRGFLTKDEGKRDLQKTLI
jgi:hypothetical protein